MTRPPVASVTPLPERQLPLPEHMALATSLVAAGDITIEAAATAIVDQHDLVACHPEDPLWDRDAALANVVANIKGNIRLAEKAQVAR